jgi:hypothetical protein
MVEQQLRMDKECSSNLNTNLENVCAKMMRTNVCSEKFAQTFCINFKLNLTFLIIKCSVEKPDVQREKYNPSKGHNHRTKYGYLGMILRPKGRAHCGRFQILTD